MKTSKTLRLGVVIIAVSAGVFALTGSAGAVSPTGQLAFMSASDGQADVYSMDVDSVLPAVNLTHDKTIGLRQDVEPAWSPTGEVVAFQRNFMTAATRTPTSGIFAVTVDGKKLGRLVPPALRDGVSDQHPTWSPDGSMLVFSSNRDGNFELYSIKSSGQGLTKLTDTKPWIQNVEPSWAPNSDAIVFVRRTLTVTPSPAALYVLRISTGQVYRLTTPASRRGDREPTWAPNGTQIAFTSDRKGQDDIFSVNVLGGELTQLTTAPTAESHAAWAPAGKTLALMSNRTGASEIYLLDLSGRSDGLKQITFDRAAKSNPSFKRVSTIG